YASPPCAQKPARLPVLISGTSLHAGLLLGIGLAVALQILLRYTGLGFRLRMLGGNPTAARLTGMNSSRQRCRATGELQPARGHPLGVVLRRPAARGQRDAAGDRDRDVARAHHPGADDPVRDLRAAARLGGHADDPSRRTDAGRVRECPLTRLLSPIGVAPASAWRPR